MVTVEDLGNGRHMAGEIALCSLGNSSTTPRNQGIFGQSGVGILDFDKCELDPTFIEVLDKVGKLSICKVPG